LAFAVGKAIRYFKDAHRRRLKSTHKKLLTRYKEEQKSLTINSQASYHQQYSSTDYNNSMSTSSNSTSSMMSSSSTTEVKEDPMAKYDLVAPELGVGLDRWAAIRKAWQTGCKDPSTLPSNKLQTTTPTKKKKYDKYVDVDSIVEHLVNPRKPAFKHPVPLPEMIVILIELWEAVSINIV
jgi:hypothetical protein